MTHEESRQSGRQRPAIEGWFEGGEDAHLVGARCTACSTVVFPPTRTFCPHPGCASDAFEPVPMSRQGRIWSYTSASYKPPEPYIAPEGEFEPFTILAVELEKEAMVVLGQAVRGVTPQDIAVGDAVELVVETLYRDEDGERTIWKWKPVDAPGGAR